MCADRAASTPIRGIHVSDQGRFGFSHIDAEEQGVEALGYVVINRVLGGVLQDALDDVGGVDVICPARVVGLELAPDRATATVADAGGEQSLLSCDLLVASDGANSAVREMMGITAQKSHYGQRAVIGNLLPEKDINFMAYERFTPQELEDYRSSYDALTIIAHPECPPDVLAVADFVGSTAQMSRYVETQRPKRVLMVTECSMSDNVAADVTDVQFIRPCNLCPHMKRIRLDRIYESLERLEPRVEIDPQVAAEARRAVERMLEHG